MSRYPKYLWAVITYMAVLIAASTVVTMYSCRMSATDSFYFVVQTLWTVGYGDVIPAGDAGRVISVAVMVFGTIGITSALGVVGGMILDSHTKRHAKLESHLEKVRGENMARLYRWGEAHGIDRKTIDRTVEEVRNEQG